MAAGLWTRPQYYWAVQSVPVRPVWALGVFCGAVSRPRGANKKVILYLLYFLCVIHKRFNKCALICSRAPAPGRASVGP